MKTRRTTAVTRRDFLQAASAASRAAALSAFLAACARAGIEVETPASPTAAAVEAPPETPAAPAATGTPEPPPASEPTAEPTPAGEPAGAAARIALVKTADRGEGVRQALALLGINPVVGKRVFLKPNYNSADPAPGSTHPDVLRALVRELQAMGAGRITVGDRSGMGDTRRVMQALGVFDLADELGFDALVFDELSDADWTLLRPPGAHWEQGIPLVRACLEAEAVVQACCLKTHRYGGHFTLSLKNSVGLVANRYPQGGHNYMQELHASPHQRRMIAEINAAYSPALVVIDGVEAFISGGPDVGERVAPEVILAGTDRVALDAAGVAILRRFGCRTEAGQGRIFDQEQIARAVELGLGVSGPEQIEFVTGDAAAEAFAAEIGAILAAG